MKRVTYIKREFVDRGRVVSIRENQDDKDCLTRVMKNFVYLVFHADAIPEDIPAPEISIVKQISSVKKTETFVFKVKGAVFVKEKRFIYCVKYCHSLCVHMFWKTHVLSTKPAVLA